MSRLSSYSKSIQAFYNFDSFENINENAQKRLLGDISSLLLPLLNGQDFITYLSGLRSSDIEPFNGVIKTLLNTNVKAENESDSSVFENVIATLATNGVWLLLSSKFSSDESLDNALKDKNFENTELKYFLCSELSKYQPFIEKVESKGFTTSKISPDEMANSPKYYSDMVAFFKLLSAENVVDDRVKRLETLAGGSISAFVSSMMETLKALYSVGFNGFPEEGLMVLNGNNSPIVRIDYQRNTVTHKNFDQNTMYDSTIAESIVGLYPNLKNYYSGNEENEDEDIIPNISYLIDNIDSPLVCYKLHLQWQSANARFTKGITSISNWVKETKNTNLETWLKENNNGKNVIEKWSDVESWYKWSLKKIFMNAVLQYNVNGKQLQGNLDEGPIILEISKALTTHLKNVIVISDRDNKKFSSMEIRISSIATVDTGSLMDSIASKLNAGGGSTIKLTKRGNDAGNVKILNVVYDEKTANKSALFAGDVVDRFIESGNIPSWGHALIGKKEDGSLFFWDGFMDPQKAGPANRCYTIYAASRSGKGVMTSTLVASALCDSRQVFYTDGKPENGATMGMVAWEKHKEAYVFDGKPEGAEPFAGPMENYTNGVRTLGETGKFLKELPKELFQFSGFNSDTHLKFLGLMRYLKSLMLCAEMIIARSKGELPKDNWQIWIFDEMTSMSTNEMEIRKIFADYCNSKGIKIKSQTDDKSNVVLTGIDTKSVKADVFTPGSLTFDAGVKYIKDWCDWCSALLNKISEANVISLGKADTNMIFIFQEPTWLRTHKRITTIAKLVNGLSATKIVGRGGIVPEAGDYGDGTIMSKDWCTKINIDGAGNWAMSHGKDIRKSEVTLFKPFNIWTVPLKGGKMNTEPLPEGEETRYFKGYTQKLLGAFNVDPADVIESAYTYADNAVKTLGLLSGSGRENIRDYLYDCCNLSVKGGTSLDDTYNDMRGIENEETSGIHSESENAGDDDIFAGFTTHTDNTDTSSTTPIGDTTSDTENVPITDDTTPITDDSESMEDPRLEQVYEMFDSKYTEVINKIVNSKEKLKNIPREEKNRVNFISLQGELLRNFNGLYLTNRNKFLDDVSKKVTDIELNKAAINHYKHKFEIDYRMLKDEIQNMQFNVVSKEDSNGGSSNEPDVNPFDKQGSNGAGSGSDYGDTSNRTPMQGDNRRGPEKKGTTVNGHKITSPIDCRGIVYDSENVDSISNVKATNKLTALITQDIKTQFGGINNIESIAVTSSGCLVINEYSYMPQLSPEFLNSLGEAVRIDVENGQIYKVVNLGRVIRDINHNIFELAIETPKVANSQLFKNELGVRNNYGVLFKTHSNLQHIYLPDQELNRNNPDQQGSGMGLGSKIANLFGFGRGNRGDNNYTPNPSNDYSGSDTIDRIFESKPVRILTGALGWTLGCKAVVFAATVFGPWGLLFGAFAAAGAYNEMKKSRNQNNNNNYNSQPRNSGGGGNKGQGKKPTNRRNTDTW